MSLCTTGVKKGPLWTQFTCLETRNQNLICIYVFPNIVLYVYKFSYVTIIISIYYGYLGKYKYRLGFVAVAITMKISIIQSVYSSFRKHVYHASTRVYAQDVVQGWKLMEAS